ncbi:MAG TPA: hypothetical protein VMS56_01900 [Thermoanaerobaculia bacterium]|nr:hypothetical protein [Thermoanaerobaculia bacterium]
MAVRWRCPRCGCGTVESDPFFGEAVRCGGCGEEIDRREVLCIVCDEPDPLRRRGTVHVECRGCGERQMIFAEAPAAP